MNSVNESKMNYHYWANMELLNHIKDLGDDIFLREVKSIFPSVSIIFSHIYQVDQMWLKRILGISETSFEEIVFETPDTAARYFEQLNQQYKNLGFTDRVINYRNTKGEIFENEFQDIILHIMNHGTYHRGNISAILHQMGQKSISTDYIYFLRK